MEAEIYVVGVKTEDLVRSICMIMSWMSSTLCSAVNTAIQVVIEYEHAIESIKSFAASLNDPFESLKEFEEISAMMTDFYDDTAITAEQKTKASYKYNIMLQNKRYDVKLKLARKQTMKASRPQIVRRFP